MIKTYLELFGEKITPAGGYEMLPPVYIPTDSNGGFISYMITYLRPLNINFINRMSEEDFQTAYGHRRLRNDHKLVVNFPPAYGLTAEQAKNYLNEALKGFIERRAYEWEKAWLAIETEYEPLENYDRIEETSHTLTKKGSETTTKAGTETMTKAGSETTTKAGSETHTKAGSEITTPTGKEITTTENNVNGYNSASSVPASDSTNTTEFDDRANTLEYEDRVDTDAFVDRSDTLEFDNRTDTLGFNNRTDTLGFTNRSDETEIESHIHGNIGVTTSQQMLESEIELRKKDFIKDIYREIADRFLLCIY